MQSGSAGSEHTSNEEMYQRRQVFARPSLYANGKAHPRGYRYYLDPPTPNPPPDDLFFLLTAVEFWLTRYIPRMHALNPPCNGLPPLADSVAQKLLIARTESRNRLFTSLTDFPEAQVPIAESMLAHSRLDINTLTEIPRYGPSFLSLWADAKVQGLSDTEALAYIWKWAKAWPSAWERDDERKQKGFPLLDPEVETRLCHVIAWTRTDDAAFPWEAHPKGQHWRIRLNDFPDDHMYTIVVNGAELGDFDDWPETWDRGAGQSALAENAITITCPVPGGDPETLVTRYQNGEHVEVWRELVALGDGIREGPYVEPANAIARETMRRARHNVELLFSRLRELDYEFYGEDSEPFRPCTPEEAEALTQAGRNGLILPLSLAAWIKEVGWVDFAGSHPALSFNEDDDGRPGIYTDPMEITCWNFLDISKAWKRRRVQKNKPVRIELGADAKSKARFAAGWQAEGTYSILLPNSAADALIDGAPTAVTFVEYLRLSFQWGGFPGWANYQKRPEKELDFLRKGLLSV